MKSTLQTNAWLARRHEPFLSKSHDCLLPCLCEQPYLLIIFLTYFFRDQPKSQAKPKPYFGDFFNANKSNFLRCLLQHSHPILSSTLMASSTNFFFRLCLFISLALAETHAATFDITNNCNFRVWAAALPVGGGRRLDQGETWSINVRSGTTGGRIWGRTNCTFDETGRGHCQTGDCDGLLDCKAYGTPPNTIAEYSLNAVNDLDYFDISLVDGFNVPVEFTPTTGNCRGPKCTADINKQCPDELKAPGGCNNACTVFKTNEYCCTGAKCNPTTYATFFIRMCPDAYSYSMDDQLTTFTCPSGTNYSVVFCPCSCSWFEEMADYVARDGTSYKVTVF